MSAVDSNDRIIVVADAHRSDGLRLATTESVVGKYFAPGRHTSRGDVAAMHLSAVYCQWPGIHIQPPDLRTQWPCTQTTPGLGRTTQEPGTHT